MTPPMIAPITVWISCPIDPPLRRRGRAANGRHDGEHAWRGDRGAFYFCTVTFVPPAGARLGYSTPAPDWGIPLDLALRGLFFAQRPAPLPAGPGPGQAPG